MEGLNVGFRVYGLITKLGMGSIELKGSMYLIILYLGPKVPK